MTNGRPFLPSTGTQIDTAVIQAGIANKVAYEQASKGADPQAATEHGTKVAGAMLSWWLFVFFPTLFAALVAPFMDSTIFAVWTLGAAVGAVVLYLALSNWRIRPVGSPSAWGVSGGLLAVLWVLWFVSIVPVAILVAVVS